jgi:hypothetical protein
MGSTRIKYMDLPMRSTRSLSPSSASSNSDLGYIGRKYNSSNSPCCGSLEDVSNCSSDSGMSGKANTEDDFANNYRKKQRNSETVTIQCVDLGLSPEEKKKLQKRNKSLSSISRLLKSFSISKSSRSLTGTPVKQKKKSKDEPPKTIYRRPVEYVYVKGMSGLATQRVPRSSICCQYS